MALLQNSLELAIIAFFDCILRHFGASSKVLMDQKRDFFEAFKALCTKALINHHTTSRNNLVEDNLAQ